MGPASIGRTDVRFGIQMTVAVDDERLRADPMIRCANTARVGL